MLFRSRIQDYVTSVKEEAVKALNDGERTQETIQTAHDNLLAAVASAQEFYDITESINEIKINIYSGMLEESPEAFTEPVGEALDAVNELLENDNRTLEELKLAYENLKAAYDRAYSAQGPYGALINAIDEIKYLISICENSVVKEELESLVESAITVLDAPDSKGDDYQSAVTSLYKYVITIFKGYESEDYTIELTNPGCHTEANDIVPDGWTIEIGRAHV